METVMVKIQDKNGKMKVIRALLDTGAQDSFISAGVQKGMEFPQYEVSFKIGAIHNNPEANAPEVTKKICAKVQGLQGGSGLVFTR